MAKGDDIQERLIDFAVRVLKLCNSLPTNFASQHIARQLIRSGTAPAAHYAEARGAESNRDFIHKLKICLKELNESRVWLTIITKSELLTPKQISDIYHECDQLCRIINASIKTAKQKQPIT